MNNECGMLTAVQMLEFSVAEGRRLIIGAGPALTDSIFCDIARRVQVVAKNFAKLQETLAHPPPLPGSLTYVE